MEFSSYSYPVWEIVTSNSVIFTVHLASEIYVQHCGCCNGSECSRRSVGRCRKQLVRGIFQLTMALITGNSEETHIVWTTRELRVWTQCCQMISWVSWGRREGLSLWMNESTVELWGMGGKSAGYAGHDILQAHPGELWLMPSSWALSSVVGEDGGGIQFKWGPTLKTCEE